MADVTATLVVIFSAGDAGGESLQAEIDSRSDGLNQGDTSFGAGDQPGFLIFPTPLVVLTSITPSTGVIQTLTNENITFTETLTFAKKKQASVTKPIFGGTLTSFKWLGNNLGDPVVVDNKTVSVPIAGVGVLKVTYVAQALRRRLTSVTSPLNGETDFDVLILIEGVAP